MAVKPAKPTTAPAVKTIEPTAAVNLPAAWGADAEVLETRVITDKNDILGMPFKVLGFEIERNERRGYDTAFVYAIDADGTEFTFSDASTTGVLKQIQDAAAARNIDPAPGAGYQAMPVVVIGGLRISEFEGQDGAPRQTYYLEGRRRTASTPK